MFKLELEKAEEPEIKLPTSSGSQKKQKNSRKASSSASLTMLKPLTGWITTNCRKFFKRWECQTTWPASWEICVQVKKQVRTRHGTTDWFQIGKGVHQVCILSPYLFYLYAEYIRRRRWHPTPVLLPGKSHGRRSLVGCSPWGRKESDMVELLNWTEV